MWAEVAERHGVDVLMVGSELNALASTIPLTAIPGLEEYFLNDDKQEQRRNEVLRHQDTVATDRPGWQAETENYGTVEDYIDARIAQEQSWAVQVAGGTDERSLEAFNRRRAMLESHWAQLIRRVREVYSGKIGYAANFDQYRDVGFWPQLDVMGINAYFKLRDRPIPRDGLTEQTASEIEEQLVQGWRNALAEIDAFRARQGLSQQPVIFTEMGYTFRLNSTLEPWSYTGFSVFKFDGREELVVWTDQPDAPLERALAVRALYRAHGELASPFLKGILYWKLSTIPEHLDYESFLVILDQPEEDPVLAELRRFVVPDAS